MARFYIDTVPIEAVDNLLKVQSSQTESNDWISWVLLRQVITFMGIRAEWARSLKSRFKTLRIGKTGVNYSRNKTAVADGIREAHDFILADGVDAIQELQVVYLNRNEEVNRTEIADVLQKFLPNVTSLSLNGEIAIWLEKFGGQIDNLVAYRDDDMRVIDKYCNKLHSLKIFGYYENPTDELICNASANTLQSLELWTPLSVGEMENLEKKFRQLKRISIKGDVDAVTELLVSYGRPFGMGGFKYMGWGFQES